eukprot:3201153-Pleurochrysis_carterae.AAC.1
MVLEGNMPLQLRQGEPRGAPAIGIRAGPNLYPRRSTAKTNNKWSASRNARENNAKRLQVANLPICVAIAAKQGGEENN